MKTEEEKSITERKLKNVLNIYGMSVAEFAKRIGRSRNTVYGIFKREFIDFQLFRKISEALDFDFIHDL